MVTYIVISASLCFLIAIMMLMALVQEAFNKSGFLWGVASMIYPPGTYKYCKTDWENKGKSFMIISGLLVVAVVLFLVAKLF